MFRPVSIAALLALHGEMWSYLFGKSGGFLEGFFLDG
jgi:hypothetical protein